MPTSDDEAPRLAELARFIQDFRNEFRSAVETMVRKDVYAANLATMEARLTTLQAELSRQDHNTQAELTRQDQRWQQAENDKKSFRNSFVLLIMGNIFTVVASIVVALVVK